MEVHHMIHGTANRKKADENGLTVHLCTRCHRLLHDKGVNDRELQKYAQLEWERKYVQDEADREYMAMNERLKALPETAREYWMSIFGKNYL